MKTKSFDCVKMKEEAQKACAQAYGGLSLLERRERIMADIKSDPEFAAIYGRFIEKSAVSKSAEARPEYKAGA